MTAKWAGIAAGGCVGLAVCCCLMKNCCENSPNCEELLVKMHCMNCAKGMQDGRSKKMDDEAPQQSAAAPHQSYQNV